MSNQFEQVLDLLEAFLGQPPLSPEQLHQLQLQQQLRYAQAQAQAHHGQHPQQQPTTPGGGSSSAEWRVELAPLAELASEKLKNLLLVMSAAGAFAPGEETIGAELWALTWAVVGERFRFCPGLREELFGAGGGGSEVAAGGGAGAVEAPQQQQPSQPAAVEEEHQQQQHQPGSHEPLAAELTGPLSPEEQEGEAMPPPVSEPFAAAAALEEDPTVSGVGGEVGDVSSLFPPLPPLDSAEACGGKGLPPASAAMGAEAPIPEGADRRGAGMAAQIV